MVRFPSLPLLHTLSFNHGYEEPPTPHNGKQNQKVLASSSSLASLVHFARNPIKNLEEAVENWYDGTTPEERARRQSLADRKQLLYLKMRMATDHADWTAAATELDHLEGNNEWKSVFESPDYDAPLVEARSKQLDEARISCDIGRMLFLIRTSLTRDLGDMGNLRMYKHAHIGTKDLIERYISSALGTLEALLDVSARAKCDAMESKYILEQVLSARQAFGRSALLLSGGATFGMNHIGVLKALWEAKLLPRIISGASAGSIVCAVLCIQTDEEIPELLDTFCDGDLAVFEEEGNEEGLLHKAVRFLKHGAVYDISHLTRVMKDLLGDITFQEAYNRTRKILNICVSSAGLYELPRLLNYITAPNVLIWSAVAASCSVPFIYTAASLLAKDPKTGEAVPWNPSPQRWIDGSVDNDIPMTRLAEMFNVNHFIVSQVNPHVVPFLIKDEDAIEEEARKPNGTISPGPTWFNSISHLAKSEALHRMHTLADAGFFPNILTKTVSVLSQKYSGDITIFPEISYVDFPSMLSNPNPAFMHRAMLAGERATWPKMSIIKNHCAIELALDDAVQKLRTRVAFSPSEVESRMWPRQTSEPRRGARRRTQFCRPLSQNSAPVGTGSIYPQRQSRSGRLTPISRHKKALSINTLLCGQSGEEQRFPKSDHLLNNLHDFTSSGADETSNVTTSSSSTSFSSPTDSPTSPIGEVKWQQVKWQRSLFGSTSQPVTPSHHGGGIFKSASHSTKPPIPALAMTPSKSSTNVSADSPESRYKRLFHHRPMGPMASNTTGRRRDSKTSMGQSTADQEPKTMKRNWGLEVEIPTAARTRAKE